MAIVETIVSISSHNDIGLRGIVEIPAGKTFKIETTPEGEEIYSKVVPTGKRWVVHIDMDIQEILV